MHLFKAFVVGTIVPTIVLPIILLTAINAGKPELLGAFFLHLIPVIWGIWNVIAHKFLTYRPYVAGGILGLIVACIGIFCTNIPEILDLGAFMYWPLVIAPVVYALIWNFIVAPLNRAFNVD